MSYLSVSEVARQIGANPKDISNLFYQRKLRDDICPIVAGRRIIPIDYIEIIKAALKQHRRLVKKAVHRG